MIRKSASHKILYLIIIFQRSQVRPIIDANLLKLRPSSRTSVITEIHFRRHYQIGKYGQMHLDYIKSTRRGRFTTLLTEGKLNARLHEIDVEAKTMVESIITKLAAERGIYENLKARDMLRWVAEMNNIKSSAEEIIYR